MSNTKINVIWEVGEDIAWNKNRMSFENKAKQKWGQEEGGRKPERALKNKNKTAEILKCNRRVRRQS